MDLFLLEKSFFEDGKKILFIFYGKDPFADFFSSGRTRTHGERPL